MIRHRKVLMAGAATFALTFAASAAAAQTATDAPPASPAVAATPQAEEATVTEQVAAESQNAAVDEVVVVGTRIRGARATAALPVTILDQAQIEATGAVSGDDLLRSVPQNGDTLFDASNNPQTSNAARGDVDSVNLRSLGVGNTLVLLNGRRIVTHPTSQGTSDTGTVPVLSYNSNAIPTTGLARLEVLLDGAAAIYGADAVAGVVNTVLRDNYDGLRVSLQYGGAESTNLREFQGSLFAGRNFDRGNITLFAEYTDRTALRAEDNDYTASADLRRFFDDEPGFDTSNDPDGRATRGPYANLATPAASGIIRRGTQALTTSAGSFHTQPTNFPGCLVNLSADVCIGSGTISYTGALREIRFDTAVGTTVLPAVERLNLFATGRYDLTEGVEAFGELGYYTADSDAVQPAVINLNTVTIPASNFYNPFGPVTFASGQTNPNRISGLTNVPAAGLPVRLTNYRFVDAGVQSVHVDNYQARALVGLRGEWRGFDVESALLYTEAEAVDTSRAVNTTLLQQSLALSTPDAYNPFNGGCIANPTFGDCTPSSAAAISAITFDLVRESRTTLAQADLRATRRDLFSLPAGEVGVAAGLEIRRETQRDNRDPNLDGTNVFRDLVSGEVNISNVAAVSPNPDTRGDRTVSSAYIEFAVPVVSPDMGIPLMRRIDLQLAGRYEHYSDFGSVAKPKAAVAWDIVDGLRLRGSYSQGFRAPNLEQTNATQYSRLASNNDYIRCEADLRAGRISTFNACSRTVSYALQISGNPDLEPEESTNASVGVVFEPRFIPDRYGRFTFTADRWRIEQEDIVGLLGGQSALVQDYLNRLGGSSFANVIRAPVNSDDAALFAGTGIAAAGQVTAVQDRFINLLPQTVEGVDFAFRWDLRGTRFGDFTVTANAARLLKFSRDPGPIVSALYDARDSGTINVATPLPDSSDLIRANGRPEWRVTGSATWEYGPFQVGAFTNYIGSVEETGFLSTDGVPWVVDGALTGNLYVQYRFEERFGRLDGTRVRLGARNITDEQPPLTSGGYLGSLYRPYGRYWYGSVSRSF